MSGASVGQGPINLAKLNAGHAWFLRQFDDVIAEAADEGGKEAERYVKSTAVPFTHRTGAIKRGQGHKVIRTRSGALLKIRNTAGHARPLESGSKPHRIVARRAKALRFVMNGALMFRRSVMHPGTKPTHFLRIATERAGVRVSNELSGRLHRLALNFKRRR